MAVYTVYTTANQLNVDKDEFEHWQQSATIKKIKEQLNLHYNLNL